MMAHYTINSYWGPRPESLADMAERLLKLTNALGEIDPAFANWILMAFKRKQEIPLLSLNETELEKLIEDGIHTNDDDTPWGRMGYDMTLVNDARGSRRCVWPGSKAPDILPTGFISKAKNSTGKMKR